jgi:hypothetical protein
MSVTWLKVSNSRASSGSFLLVVLPVFRYQYFNLTREGARAIRKQGKLCQKLDVSPRLRKALTNSLASRIEASIMNKITDLLPRCTPNCVFRFASISATVDGCQPLGNGDRSQTSLACSPVNHRRGFALIRLQDLYALLLTLWHVRNNVHLHGLNIILLFSLLLIFIFGARGCARGGKSWSRGKGIVYERSRAPGCSGVGSVCGEGRGEGKNLRDAGGLSYYDALFCKRKHYFERLLVRQLMTSFSTIYYSAT